ncbi:MAG: anthranilate synthase component I family protein [Capnocytophaga sp.]|nr:anthranilate synthase component I family protein [Capnocytophaga sp.]
MKPFSFQTHTQTLIADTVTPVSIYLKIRDKYPNSILLESSDYQANSNSFSFICFTPIADIKVENETITQRYPDGTHEVIPISSASNIPDQISHFASRFHSDYENSKVISNGLFGYIAYDAVRYFETVHITKKDNSIPIPDVYYAVYKNVIAIDHFKNEAHIFSHVYGDDSSELPEIIQLLKSKNFTSYNFQRSGEASSNMTDGDFKQMVRQAKEHCFRGDVFQLVLGRRFQQAFKGDEFNVYRALRSINPSPYLFFFDFGNFKLFGSSPEAQLIVREGKAEIHPIAGTFRRTGNDAQDAELAKVLSEDAKENAEHVMLVDLARNDLSRNGSQVEVETFKEVQFFSHVIHLVSKVTGMKKTDIPTMQVVADTFPAGTLSGAPKPMALRLIEKYEPTSRGYYGGAIGFMDFKGNFNHAIMIRTFLCHNHKLYFQAGAGIVAASSEENETQEVYNKLGALQKALQIAENI